MRSCPFYIVSFCHVVLWGQECSRSILFSRLWPRYPRPCISTGTCSVSDRQTGLFITCECKLIKEKYMNFPRVWKQEMKTGFRKFNDFPVKRKTNRNAGIAYSFITGIYRHRQMVKLSLFFKNCGPLALVSRFLCKSPKAFLSTTRGTQRKYSSKPLKHSIVKRVLVFKRWIWAYFYPL